MRYILVTLVCCFLNHFSFATAAKELALKRDQVQEELQASELKASALVSRFLDLTEIHNVDYAKIMRELNIPFEESSYCHGAAGFAIEYALIHKFQVWLRLNKALIRKGDKAALKKLGLLTSKKMMRYSKDQNILRTYTETETTHQAPYTKTVMFLNNFQNEEKLKDFCETLIKCKKAIHIFLSFKGHSMALIKDTIDSVVLVNSGKAHRVVNSSLLALSLRKLLLAEYSEQEKMLVSDYTTQLESFTFEQTPEIAKVYAAMDRLYEPVDKKHFLESEHTNLWNLQHVNIGGLKFLGYTQEEIAYAYGVNLSKRLEDGQEGF